MTSWASLLHGVQAGIVPLRVDTTLTGNGRGECGVGTYGGEAHQIAGSGGGDVRRDDIAPTSAGPPTDVPLRAGDRSP